MTSKTLWTKACFKCGDDIVYTNKRSWYNSIRNGTPCKNCRDYSKVNSTTPWSKLCTSCGVMAYFKSEKMLNRSTSLHCKICTQFKVPVNAIQPKYKERTCPVCECTIIYKRGNSFWSAIRKNSKCVECNKITPRYSLVACRIFDEMEKELGWNGQYATKGGEFTIIGYSVDYYEPTLNIVIEYDERAHKYKKQYKTDAVREKRITGKLNCKFYRIPEGSDWRTIIK